MYIFKPIFDYHLFMCDFFKIPRTPNKLLIYFIPSFVFEQIIEIDPVNLNGFNLYKAKNVSIWTIYSQVNNINKKEYLNSADHFNNKNYSKETIFEDSQIISSIINDIRSITFYEEDTTYMMLDGTSVYIEDIDNRIGFYYYDLKNMQEDQNIINFVNKYMKPYYDIQQIERSKILNKIKELYQKSSNNVLKRTGGSSSKSLDSGSQSL